MGVPKFFRWISERYPLTCELIQENRIPVFDNLYLDMNGIIHNCSHANNDSAHYRISEAQIFINIFNYIEHLFNKIKPTQVFFLAVDGVAPRAKMNQQRSRRFRTAKEAQEAIQKAISKGQELPKEPPFDSNCITPGTPFMTKLHEQLKYFINKKISEDSNWARVRVILSGHDVPGEGEHKIMEYIRHEKSQPNYHPNTRHCMYGLDADLVMLGLLSHEPHFSLLREEVVFGRKKKSVGLEGQLFYLLHLSLFRDYLDLEFQSLHDYPHYNLERIIDDFILMTFFVGNDFLPHIPGLSIHEGALNRIFKIYKSLFSIQGGYMNVDGELHLQRVELFLRELGKLEFEEFESILGVDSTLGSGTLCCTRLEGGSPIKPIPTISSPNSKSTNSYKSNSNSNKKSIKENGKIKMKSMSKKQFEYYLEIKKIYSCFNESDRDMEEKEKTITIEFVDAIDKSFLVQLAQDLGLVLSISDDSITLELDSDEDESDEESVEARQRVFKRYDAFEILEVSSNSLNHSVESSDLELEFNEWKATYYREKLFFSKNVQIQDLVYSYVQGLQWVLYYYFHGVASWEWFYPFHYAPRPSDLLGLEFKFEFELGKPFQPFEQLMAVLPASSSQHIPIPLRDLMTSPHSPILDFYPTDFELDMNGKKNDWEAIVLIPFIQESRLLKAIESRQHLLDKEEKDRNSFGNCLLFTRASSAIGVEYPSSLPGIFPMIPDCHCIMSKYQLQPLGNKKINDLNHKALAASDLLPGFPSLHSLKDFVATLGYHGVNIYQSESKNESIVLTLTNPSPNPNPNLLGETKQDSIDDSFRIRMKLAKEFIGNSILVNWPFLIEARVVCIEDEFGIYSCSDDLSDDFPTSFSNTSVNQRQKKEIKRIKHSEQSEAEFFQSIEYLERHYSKRFGIITGNMDILVHVQLLVGMKLTDDYALVKDYSETSTRVPLQLILQDSKYFDPRFQCLAPPKLELEFPISSQVLFLGTLNYGSLADVKGYNGTLLDLIVYKTNQPEWEFLDPKERIASVIYKPSFIVAKELKITPLVLAKITSSCFVVVGEDEKINIGLGFKFEARKKKVLGISQKSDKGWEFSMRAISLIREYKERFPLVFKVLEKSSKGDFYHLQEFVGVLSLEPNKMNTSPTGPYEYLQSISTWLSTNLESLDSVDLSISSLDKQSTKQIESLIDSLYQDIGPPTYSSITILKVPRQSVLKPNHALYRLGHQTFELGDRIISVLDQGSVPLGSLGTVVGILQGQSYVNVLFDLILMGGNDLNGLVSPFRGMTMSRMSILNLSKQQPPIRRASSSTQVFTSSNKKKNSINSQNTNVKPKSFSNGQSQWKPRPTSATFTSTNVIAPSNGQGQVIEKTRIEIKKEITKNLLSSNPKVPVSTRIQESTPMNQVPIQESTPIVPIPLVPIPVQGMENLTNSLKSILHIGNNQDQGHGFTLVNGVYSDSPSPTTPPTTLSTTLPTTVENNPKIIPSKQEEVVNPVLNQILANLSKPGISSSSSYTSHYTGPATLSSKSSSSNTNKNIKERKLEIKIQKKSK